MSVASLCIILIVVFYLPSYLSENAEKPGTGPYKSTIIRVTKCDSPYRPYTSDPPISFTPLVSNTSTAVVLSGNVTISKETKNVKFRMKSAIWENNKWRTNYLMSEIGCQGLLLHLILSAIHVRYDKKNCMFLKGQYNFKNIDFNAMEHLWASKMEYGRVLWRSEAYHPKLGTFFCHVYETVTEPI